MVSSHAPVKRHVTVRLPCDPTMMDGLATDGEGYHALARSRDVAVAVHEARQRQGQAECVSPITVPTPETMPHPLDAWRQIRRAARRARGGP